MNRPSPELVDCPTCGVKNFAIDEYCHSCRATLCVVIGPKPKIRRFGLWSLMIGIAVLAICFGLFREAPALGVPVALVLLPATLRSLFEIESQRAEGEHLSDRMRFTALFHALLGSLCLLPVAGIAFLVTCVPAGAASWNLYRGRDVTGLVVAVIAGLVVGTVISILVGRKLWPNLQLPMSQSQTRARPTQVGYMKLSDPPTDSPGQVETKP